MNVTFEYNNVSGSERLESLILKKLNKLMTRYDFVVRARVFLKSENTSSPETGKICNIQLSVPGPLLFAEANSASFEASLQESIGELERQLTKKKEKMKAH